MSLLSLIADTCDLIGIARPTSVVSSTDQQVRQLLGLAKLEGDELAESANWQALVNEHTFVTTATAAQTNTPVPDDLRAFLPDTFFNRTTARQVVGPITPQQWQILQARPVQGRVYLTFRQREGSFLMSPTPTAGETIAYEYISSYWVKSSAGVAKAAYTSDDDQTYLDEKLIKLGLVWRWKAAKGLPYAEDMETYERAVQKAAGEDGGSASLSMVNRGPRLLEVNIPEGSIGV